MKNITISLDDETYRKARVAAAQRDASVSALVKKYLLTLTEEEAPAPRNLKQEQEALLDAIWNKHPKFTTRENLSREALHERP
ncbi:MAG TPA: DUF6364 family protein [Candidatus Limnocylindria bacterium]|nr:DUF6364 family protein [Candidatus Limnocylindria bacterium]